MPSGRAPARPKTHLPPDLDSKFLKEFADSIREIAVKTALPFRLSALMIDFDHCSHPVPRFAPGTFLFISGGRAE